MEISLSRNSYIFSPRSVTIAPIGMPSPTLKAAIDFFALVDTGFCPAIAVRSATSGSSILGFWVASPSPMFSTIFSRRGTAIGFFRPSSFCSAGRISFWYFSCIRVAIVSSLSALCHGPWSGLALFLARIPLRGVVQRFVSLYFLLPALGRDRLAALLADPHLGVALELVAHACRPAARTHQHHIRDLDRRLLF